MSPPNGIRSTPTPSYYGPTGWGGPATYGSAIYGLTRPPAETFADWKKTWTVGGVFERIGHGIAPLAAMRVAMPYIQTALVKASTSSAGAFIATSVAIAGITSFVSTLQNQYLNFTSIGDAFAQFAIGMVRSLPTTMAFVALGKVGLGHMLISDLALQIPMSAVSATWGRILEGAGLLPERKMDATERFFVELGENTFGSLWGRSQNGVIDRTRYHYQARRLGALEPTLSSKEIDARVRARLGMPPADARDPLHTAAIRIFEKASRWGEPSAEAERQAFLRRIDGARVQALAARLESLSKDKAAHVAEIATVKRDLVDIWSKARGGQRPIQRVLIANNGMSAVRLIAGIRDQSGRIASDLGINSRHGLIDIVGLASAADLEAKPRYLGEVDRLIECQDKPTPTELFLDAEYVLNLAKKQGADAVAVGWGFASERAEFAELCVSKGLTFIGPPAAAMKAMGGKISSKHLAERLGVRVLPWSKGAVRDVRHAADVAEELGWHVAVKADAGGGGRGIEFMRGLTDPKFVEWCAQRGVPATADQARRYVGELFAGCQSVGQSYFKDPTVFIEQLAPPGVRHIEFQVEVDETGRARVLAERDCSAQIRNQKVLEEGGNGIVVPAATRTRMYRGVERLAEALGYENLGTMEFLYNPGEDDFYFMEMNTRLQVEHPVTEELLGLDLVGQQLQRAMGIPFTRRERAEFRTAVEPKKHVIAARINALGFSLDAGKIKVEPRTGTVTRLVLPQGRGIRVYSSVSEGSEISQHTDSQFVHVFASADTRQEACALLRKALRETVIEGVESTLPLSIAVLEDPEFIAGQAIDTSWLEGFAKRFIADGTSPQAPIALMAAAIHRFEQDREISRARYNRALESGHEPFASLLQAESTFELPLAGQPYATTVRSLGNHRYVVTLDGRSVEVGAIPRSGQYTLIVGDGPQQQTHSAFISGNSDNFAVQLAGERFVIAANDPARIRLSAPGTIVKLDVQVGQEVKVGDVLFTSEAMKMQIEEKARISGRIKAIHVAEKGTFKQGELIVEIEPSGDADKITQAPRLSFPEALISPLGRLETFRAHLAGHDDPVDIVHDLVLQAMRGRAYISTVGPNTIYDEALAQYGRHIDQVRGAFEALPQEIKTAFIRGQRPNSVGTAHAQTLVEMQTLLRRIQQLGDAFVEGERLFGYGSYPLDLLQADVSHAFTRAQSHDLLPLKRHVLGAILNGIDGLPYDAASEQVDLVRSLRAISDLRGEDYRPLRYQVRPLVAAARARAEEGPDLDALLRRAQVSQEERIAVVDELVAHPTVSTSQLLDVLSDAEAPARTIAAEIVVRRAYARHDFAPESFRVEVAPELNNRQYCAFEFFDRQDRSLRLGIAVHIDNQEEGITNGVRRAAQALGREQGRLAADRDRSGDTLELVLSGLDAETLDDSARLVERLSTAVRTNGTGTAFGDTPPKRVTFTVVRNGSPDYYTFRPGAVGGFVEDIRFRGLHPHNANLLEMHRFEGWRLKPLQAMHPLVRSWEVELATGKDPDRRVTTRAIVPDARLEAGPDGYVMRGFEEAYEEAARALNHELEGYEPKKRPPLNHLYLRVLAPIDAPVKEVERLIRETILRHRGDSSLLRSAQVEVRATVRDPGNMTRVREALFILKGPTSLHPTLQTYMLMRDNGARHLVKLERYMQSLERGAEPLGDTDRIVFGRPYRPKSALEKARLASNAAGKIYVYDEPDVMAEQVRSLWQKEGLAEECPVQPVRAVELVLNQAGQLEEVVREPMQNDRTLVGWRMHIHLPYENGPRQAIVVSSDPTLGDYYGSISPREGVFYKAALDLACREGLPFLQNFDGSGARIALDPNILEHARAHGDIDYLTEASYNAKPKRLDPEYAHVQKVGDLVTGDWIDLDIDGQRQRVYRIETVIGGIQGLNTENLTQGSGTMAGTMERSYWRIPTMTIAKGMLVGILKYLASQGRRLIHVVHHPLIFTGKDSLNALQGREVFRSNQELGDYSVMGKNGVAQYPARDVSQALAHWFRWLSYLPRRVGERAPVRPNVPVDDGRNVQELLLGRRGETDGVILDKSGAVRAYDPRELVGAVFDRDSFMPRAEEWALGVLTGHARLGGIPCGLIVTDVRPHMEVVPANPMIEGSEQRMIPRPAQRWDSPVADKTAKALDDFDNEGLPTIFVANFKGFPGGSFEMGYEAAVKRGSEIVEAVVGMRGADRVRQPIIVLVPPHGEMRGGAQVVIDRAINPGTLAYLVDEHGQVSVLARDGMMVLPMVKKPLAADRSADARRRMERLVDLHQTPERALAVGTVDEILRTGDLRAGLHRHLVALMDRVDLARDSLAAREDLWPIATFAKIPLPHDLSTFDRGLLALLPPQQRDAFIALLDRATRGGGS